MTNRIKPLILAIGLLLNMPGDGRATEGSRAGRPPAGSANVDVVQSRALIDCWPTTSGRRIDDDNDGIVDRCEQTLAEKFAPVIYHFEHERNYPTNVDWFLRRTELRFYDDECDLFEGGDFHETIVVRPTQLQLLGHAFSNTCGATFTAYSDGTRSEEKERTFYLADLPEGDKIGSRNNTSEWTTYFHAYRNDKRGVTIQYWRLYAADSGKLLGIFGGHGGDWEGIHVVLDDCLRPVQVNYMSHTSIDIVPWSQVNKDGNRPLVGSEIGGHASSSFVPFPQIPGLPPIRYTRQQTWTGGRVFWFDGGNTANGPLLNIGEKMRPLYGQHFIRYSGIWGSPGILKETSGYWGPAYNETEKGGDHFIKAWCIGRAADVPDEECYPRERIN